MRKGKENRREMLNIERKGSNGRIGEEKGDRIGNIEDTRKEKRDE